MKSLLRFACSLLVVGFLLQGSSCSSSQILNGRKEMEKENWTQSKAYFEAALKENPDNAEAWYYLVTVENELGNFEGMVQAAAKAEKLTVEPERKRELSQVMFKIWTDYYNNGIAKYTAASKASGKAIQDSADAAIQNLERAISLKPEDPSPYRIIAFTNDLLENQAGSKAAFTKYVEGNSSAIDFMVNKGLTMQMPRKDVLATLGTPVESVGGKAGADSTHTDLIKVDGKDVYAIFLGENGTNLVLDGLRVGLPEYWLKEDRFRAAPFYNRTLSVLAYMEINDKQWDKAGVLLSKALMIDPGNEEVMRLQTRLVQESGDTEALVAQYKTLVEKFPDNSGYLLQYGTVLMNNDKYEEAITWYEKALKADPKNDLAMYNMAAAYQNMASIKQKEEQAKKFDDRKYELKVERYFPDLRKAAEYYEAYRAIGTNASEYLALKSMFDIALILDQKERAESLLKVAESIENKDGNNSKAGYYNALGTMYAKMNMTDKSTEAYKKSDSLR